ncbi:hypothetical protein V1478_018509 [Vespula squamosa]|uniref:Uncharacterized protein n=1 Tax=Vespula squamosa TaxID=30214 RepID=A0ABD1ZU95_VESSQ
MSLFRFECKNKDDVVVRLRRESSASSSNKSFLAGLPVEGGRSVDADEKRGKNEENKWVKNE